MGEVIAITSGNGGAGKTALTANIGAALASLGKKVCLVDLNFGLRSLDLFTGLENRVIFNLADVIENECNIRQALIRDRRFEEPLYLLPAPQTVDLSYAKLDQVNTVITELREMFDYVIIDTPTGMNKGLEIAMKAADNALVVVLQTAASTRAADKLLGLMEKWGSCLPLLVFNKIQFELIEKKAQLDLEEIMTILDIDLLGILKNDSEMILAENLGEPIVFNEFSMNKEAFFNIAKRIMGENAPTPQGEYVDYFLRPRPVIEFEDYEDEEEYETSS